MLKKTTIIALLAILTLGASAVHAEMILLDKDTQGQGNKGASFRPWTDATHTDAADFVMTARTGIDDDAPLVADAPGLTGTVYIDKDGKGGKLHGAGVQTLDGGGSKGISGGGGDKDEEIIFTYDNAVYVSGVSIMLGDIEFGDAGEEDKDDPVIFIQTAGSSTFDVMVSEADILAAFTYVGDRKKKVGMVNFNNFSSTLGLEQDAAMTAFKVRETNGHLYVTGASSGSDSQIPEPATMCILACGGIAILQRRRRKLA